MELRKDEHWLDRPLLALKDLAKTSKTREKSFKSTSLKKCKNKKVSKMLDKAAKLMTTFLKAVGEFKKQKKTKRNDFNNNMYLGLSQESSEDECAFGTPGSTNVTLTIAKNSEAMLSILQKHLKHPSHWVRLLIKEFFNNFAKVYGDLCTSSLLIDLHDLSKKYSTGEFTTNTQREDSDVDYSIFDEYDFFPLIEKCFYDINSIVNLIVDTLPLYYSGMIEKNIFLLIKEQLVNFIMSEYVRDEIYDILFTFSRLATFKLEKKLYEWIKKSGLQLWNKSSHTTSVESTINLELLEGLYRQIHPDFRKVQIDNHRTSWTNSICYNPKNRLGDMDFSKQEVTKTRQSELIQFKYENGAEKLSTLNLCQSPLEKILMIKWVSESIKQDCEIWLEDHQEPIQICGDTLVSIFAYIAALSQNFLLYAHLYMTQALVTKDLKFHAEEGYYVCILQTSLSLLCEYEDQTEELMLSIINYEDCMKIKNLSKDDISFCDTAPTPTMKKVNFDFSFCVASEPDEASVYTPKNKSS